MPKMAHHLEGRVQYLLEAEEQILRSIAGRAPVPQILDEICTALDRQIGNMISFISLPEDDVAATTELARNADRFGLYIFYSGGIFDEGGGEIGFLEMYCCTARDPFVHELQLITRAICLATIALECEPKADHQANHRRREKGPARGNVLSWPAPMN
jgi:hypothetical protein